MADRVKIILNSFGGPLNRSQKLALIQQGMEAAGQPYHLSETERPLHGTELTLAAIEQGFTTIIAGGGDGTINEVVNGMMQSGRSSDLTLGILPLGTANDLAAALKLPANISQVCVIIAAGKTRVLDIGRVNGHHFANNAAIGLEPVVTITQHQMRWLKGSVRYIVAALKVIGTAEKWQVRMTWDDGAYSGPVVLVSVGNSPRTGGAFYLTPQAKVDDGQFDVIFGLDINRLQMLGLLPKILSGSHLGHPLVRYLRTQTLAITADPPTPIQADGEVIDTAATEIRYELTPAALHVLVG
jgi:YegS/Rv2252/BmrU family lipid kinase